MTEVTELELIVHTYTIPPSTRLTVIPAQGL
jgi:hypothetical protein